ncbi:MAG: O-antigen ligase family protein [Bacteroidota bacterium]
MVNIIKDISHFGKPIIVITIGYLTFKSIDDVTLFSKTIVHIALLTAIIHLIGVFGFSNLTSGSIKGARDFGLDNFIEVYALYFILLAPKISVRLFGKSLYTKIALAILIMSIFLYFSRTMFGMIIILGFSFYGYARLTRKSLKVIGALLLLLFLFYGYLGTIKLERNSKGMESLLYKIKIAPSEIVNSKIDREDHRDLWDHWRAYEAKRAFQLMSENPSSYFIGSGYGSLVNLKFIAPLGEDGMRYISVLHNGYVFVLYKTGIFGIFIYLVFLFGLYLHVYRNDGNTYFLILISTIGIYFLFTSVIITGIYIPKDAILFILGGALYHKNSIQQ